MDREDSIGLMGRRFIDLILIENPPEKIGGPAVDNCQWVIVNCNLKVKE